MPRTADALERLTAQHEQLFDLLHGVTTVEDDGSRALALCKLADAITTHLEVEQAILVTAPDPDHAELRRVINELVALDLHEVPTSSLLDELRSLLERHIGAQDDVLFVQLAEVASEDVLLALGEQVRERSENLVCVAA